MIGLDYATSEREVGKYWMKKTDTGKSEVDACNIPYSSKIGSPTFITIIVQKETVWF